jgi:ribonucleotide reductase alpha subunit
VNPSNKILSDITAFTKYAKYLPHLGRRETLAETINRCMSMHLDKFSHLSYDITKAFQRVHDLRVMPSMRSLQFAGEAVLKNPARQYNCSYTPINDTKTFSEVLFLLLSGVGVGFSVQRDHVNQLPKITMPKEQGLYVVQDSIVGWAEALNTLMEAYFFGKIKPEYDFSQVRPKGSYLVTTGAKAPGPEPLKYMLKTVEGKLLEAMGRRLKPIEVHDIVCIISDCVLSGGIRRAALISVFDRDDMEMLKAKHGEWWVKHPYRARSNNSAVLPYDKVTKEEFFEIFKICQDSNSGEPGFSWTNNTDWSFNPCVSGNTEILTRNGYERIDSVVDTEVEVWNGFEWSKVTPKVTGTNQEMLTITFNNGISLECTKYHKFHIATNYTGGVKIIEAKDLEPGMKLIKHEFPIIEHGKVLENAYTQGFVSAEGMDNYKFCWVYEPKKMCIERLKENASRISEESFGRVSVHFKAALLPKNFVPFEYNLKSKLDWLSGLFDGDGCELKEGGLQLTSIDKQFLLNVQKLLSTVGVSSKVVAGMKAGLRSLPDGKGEHKDFNCQEAYRILVGSVQMQNLKKLGLSCERLKFDKSPQRDASQFVSVVDVVDSGVAEKVYCFNEPKNHTGIFGGVITGQCHEIALNPNQFCNLSTINQSNIKDKRDFMNRVHSATLIGTLQAAYTDFHYLRPIWREQTEREALLGVSFTGIADGTGIVTNEWLKEGAEFAKEINLKYAKKLGINPAARITTTKPEGTSSCILGSSSGVHARHAPYYIRRIRMNKDDALAVYLRAMLPDLVEDDKFSSTGVVVSIPQESPKNSVIRNDETAFTLFQRTLDYNTHWVRNGHRYGDNHHNVSATISVRPNEWDTLKEQMWENRYSYHGISLLPYDNGTYVQAPFEECTEEKYNEMMTLVKEVDLTQVREEEDKTTRAEELACVGGVCLVE